jgi:two-component system LytT family sensor kinase
MPTVPPLICAAAALVLLAGVWFVNFRLRQKTVRDLEAKNREIAAQKREIEKINLELEKRMLRAQINPHFLFNALSSIQHFITDNDKVSALRYLSKFSKLLRQTLEQSGNATVLLNDEITFLQNYLELEALRFDHAFTFSLEVAPDVDVHNTELPILLVQPYVENAILHGLSHHKSGGHLSITFTKKNDHTVCTIRDNGIGRRASEALKKVHHPSRGMAITERRIALLFDNTPVPVQITDLYDEKTGEAAGTEVVVPLAGSRQ